MFNFELFVILHVEEIVTGVFEGERRADVGKLHLLMQELDTRGSFATVITLGDGGGAIGDVTAEVFSFDAEDDSHVAYFEVDGGVLLDLGENFFCIFHSSLIVGSGSIDALLEEVSEGDGMAADEIHDGGVKRSEDVGSGGDESRLMAVASGEILRGDDTDLLARLRLHEKDFGVVVGEVGALHRLGDKCPKFEGLVRGLVVEDKIEGGDVA